MTEISENDNCIPDEIKRLRQWSTWRLVDGRKVPKQPSGQAAKSNDPTTWCDFSEVANYSQKMFFLKAENGLVGIDLDDCSVDGKVAEWAAEIIERFANVAYIEVSPSGEGVKLLTRGTKPVGSRSNVKLPCGGGVECYNDRRGWTVTGRAHRTANQIGDGQAEIDWLIGKYFEPQATSQVLQSPPQDDRYAQAKRYLAKCDQAVEGERNNAAFRLAGHLAAFRLTQREVEQHLALWNLGNSPPLDEQELLGTVRSAMLNGTPRPPKELLTPAVDALGQQAATAFLAGEAPKRRWLIPADEFCGQPAAIKWLVKKWIPEKALCMVHGPSGSGKTFAVLDWVLRVAAGMGDWQGHAVKPGSVVILAGEGHAGLRGRVAAWKQNHGIKQLSCYVSQAGIELDTAAGCLGAADAINALHDPPTIVVVDTLHSHMTGDENSAKDTGAMLAGCRQIMSAFGCTVLLVHHTGNSEAAQHRARGSSAWRAALDIEISVEEVKGVRVVTQRKNKDAELSEPKAFEIQSVEIEGWVDDDGDPYRSAVAVPTDVPEKPKRPDRIEEHRRTFANAWWSTGAHVTDDRPYVSRHDLFQFLTGQMGLSEQSARQYVKESAPTKLIGSLIGAGAIERAEHGWAICETDWASQLVLNRSENTQLPCAVTSDNKNTQLPARIKRPVTSGNQRRKATKGAKRKGKTHPR